MLLYGVLKMIYNWEFDDSVDFAPPHYRKSKYQKVEQLGKQIINEATALEYLEAFQYIEYLSKYHKIDNLAMSMFLNERYN